MFGIGMPELIVIFLMALIVLGPKKLPDVAKAIGKGIIQFKRTLNALEDDEDAGKEPEESGENKPKDESSSSIESEGSEGTAGH